ncbi:MAG: TIM-barrel domain-containing protein, partial [bacterium]
MTFTDIWKIDPMPAEGAVVSGDGYRITVLTDRLLRLEYEPDNRFRDGATATALNRRFPLPAFEVRRAAGRLTIETASLRLEYDMKPFSPSGLSAVLKNALLNHASVWHYGESVGNLKGTARTLDQADGGIKKAYFMGEQDRPLDMGDGLMSMDGFAVLDDSASMGMSADGRLTPADGVAIDIYLFAYGHDFKAALRDFYQLSGPVPILPRYALGNWWSRYYCYTEQTYKALMERFAVERVPLSVAVIDMNWHITDIDPKYGT